MRGRTVLASAVAAPVRRAAPGRTRVRPKSGPVTAIPAGTSGPVTPGVAAASVPGRTAPVVACPGTSLATILAPVALVRPPVAAAIRPERPAVPLRPAREPAVLAAPMILPQAPVSRTAGGPPPVRIPAVLALWPVAPPRLPRSRTCPVSAARPVETRTVSATRTTWSSAVIPTALAAAPPIVIATPRRAAPRAPAIRRALLGSAVGTPATTVGTSAVAARAPIVRARRASRTVRSSATRTPGLRASPVGSAAGPVVALSTRTTLFKIGWHDRHLPLLAGHSIRDLSWSRRPG